ncbi:MAG: hypothetical protein DELT_00708 [Desulfovibrio sp.]
MTAKRFTLFLSLLLMALMLASGCGKRTAPVHNISDATFPVSSATGSLTKVKKAISTACIEQGWIIQEDAPNRLRAKLILRSHEAVVDIPYTTKKYSIVYVSSSNLAYQDGNIHIRYNSWVNNLAKAINLEFARSR